MALELVAQVAGFQNLHGLQSALKTYGPDVEERAEDLVRAAIQRDPGCRLQWRSAIARSICSRSQVARHLIPASFLHTNLAVDDERVGHF